MTMVEKVARAIHGGTTYPPWDTMGEVAQGDFLNHARAAIEAMREPTEKMSLVGWKALEGNPVSPPLQCWDYMIDEALK